VPLFVPRDLVQEILPEVLTFARESNGVAKDWLGLEEAVRDSATEQKWRELVLMIRKTFEGDVREERPACIALSNIEKTEKSLIEIFRKGRNQEEDAAD
jgi:hypothetical protein